MYVITNSINVVVFVFSLGFYSNSKYKLSLFSSMIGFIVTCLTQFCELILYTKGNVDPDYLFLSQFYLPIMLVFLVIYSFMSFINIKRI